MLQANILLLQQTELLGTKQKELGAGGGAEGGRAPGAGGGAGRSWLDAVVVPAGVKVEWEGILDRHVWYGMLVLILVWIIAHHYP